MLFLDQESFYSVTASGSSSANIIASESFLGNALMDRPKENISLINTVSSNTAETETTQSIKNTEDAKSTERGNNNNNRKEDEEKHCQSKQEEALRDDEVQNTICIMGWKTNLKCA